MHQLNRRMLNFLACAAIGVLAGCRTTIQVTSTPIPSLTPLPTPVSTPLPPVPTSEPFGFSEDRAYALIIRPDADSDATGSALSDAIADQVILNNQSLVFNVQVVTRSVDVVDALCSETPAVAWADGWSLLTARARDCGRVVLKIERDNAIGQSADLIVGDATTIRTLEEIRGAVYCRIGDENGEQSVEDQLYGWLLPALLMRTVTGFDPARDMQVRQVPDRAALLREVAAGNCIGGVRHGTLPSNSGTRILSVTPVLPYGGLVVSNRVPGEAASRIVRFFQENPEALEGLISADELSNAAPNDFSAIEGLLSSARIDLATLGN